jgi:hypothetical protein
MAVSVCIGEKGAQRADSRGRRLWRGEACSAACAVGGAWHALLPVARSGIRSAGLTDPLGMLPARLGTRAHTGAATSVGRSTRAAPHRTAPQTKGTR